MKVVSKVSNVVARFICSMNLYLDFPLPVYIIVYSLSCIHTWIIMTVPKSQIAQAITYTDYSFFVKASWNLSLFAALQAIITLFFIIKAIKANWHQELSENSLVEKWITKLIGIFAFIVCHAFSLPIISFSVRILRNMQFNQNLKMSPYTPQLMQTVLAWINLILLFVNTQTLTVLVFDHRPFSKNIYASINHFDLIKVMPLIKYGMGILFCIDRQVSFQPAIPIVVLLMIMFFTIKQPILQYNYDILAKILAFSTTWTFMVRVVSIVIGTIVPYPFIIVGLFMWNIVMIHICNLRVKAILIKPKTTVRQLKTVVYLLNYIDKTDQLIFPYMFLLLHKGKCEDVQCKARRYKNLHKFDQNPQNYYLMIKDIIQNDFQSISAFDQQEVVLGEAQLSKMQKLFDSFVLYISITSTKEEKHNLGLHKMQRMKHIIDSTGSINLGLRVYFFHYRINYQKQMRYKLAQPMAQNEHAKKYASCQMQIQKFYSKLIQLKENNILLWQEMQFLDCDFSKILQFTNKILQGNSKLEQSYKNIIQIFPESQRIVYKFYYEYQKTICNKKPSKNNLEEIEVVHIDANMKKYNYNAKTGVIKASLNQGQDFGRITFANLFLRSAIQAPNDLNLKENHVSIYDFIPQDLHRVHDQRIKNFVYSNPIQATNYLAVLVTLNGNIKRIQTLSQISSSFTNGLQVFTFISVYSGKKLILCNEKGTIQYFSSQFLQDIVQGLDISKQALNDFNAPTIRHLISAQNQSMFIEIKRHRFQVILLRIFGDQKCPRYLCEFLFENQQKVFHGQTKEETFSCSFFSQNLMTSSKTVQSNKKSNKSSFYPHKNNNNGNGEFVEDSIKEQKKEQQQQNCQKLAKESVAKQLDSFYQVTNGLKNGSRLKVFACLSVLLLITYIISPVVLIYLSSGKFASIDAFIEKDAALRSFIPSVIKSVIYLRQMNIQAYGNKNISRFNFVKEQMKKSSYESTQLINDLQLSGFTQIRKFDILDNGQIQVTLVPYFLLIREQILVSLTYLSNCSLSDFGMALRSGQNAHPMPSLNRRFYQVILNSLNGVVGRQQNFYEKIIQDQLCNLGKCVEKDPTYYISITGILMAVTILGLFMYYYSKINKIKLQVFRILKLIPDQIVQDKLKSLDKYSLNYLQSKAEAIEQPNNGVQSHKNNQNYSYATGHTANPQAPYRSSAVFNALMNLGKTKRQNRTSSIRSSVNGTVKAKKIKDKQASDSRRNTSLFFKSSQKQTQKKQTQIKPRQRSSSVFKVKLPCDPNKLNQKRRFTMPPQNIKAMGLRFILIGLPLIAYFIFIASYQLYLEISISQEFKVINLLYQKWQFIQDIQLLSLEIGISEPINIRGAGKSNITYVTVNEKLSNVIQKLYQVDRKIIQSLPLTGNPKNLADVVYRFNNQNVCQFLDQLAPGGNFEYAFSKEECQLLEGRQYLTKGMRSGIIALLDKSQQILLQYKNCAACDTPAIEFANLPQHKLFSGLALYFKKIIDYQIGVAILEIKDLLQKYKKSEIVVNLIGCVLGIVVFLFLMLKTRKIIIESLKQLRGVLFVISQKTIRGNQQLSNLVASEIQFDYLR